MQMPRPDRRIEASSVYPKLPAKRALTIRRIAAKSKRGCDQDDSRQTPGTWLAPTGAPTETGRPRRNDRPGPKCRN